MQVTFYIQTSPSNKVNKTLGTVIKTCPTLPNPDGPIDVINPVFLIDGPLDSSVNYFYVDAPLYRYYFVTALDFRIANKVMVTGHVDVLMTYRNFLRSNILNYCRGAGDINEMDDSSYPISDYMIEQYFPLKNWTPIFSKRGSDRQYLLRTVKGNAKIYPTVHLADGAVVWCGTYEEDEGTLYYDCYQLRVNGTLTSLYNRRQDVTGITQVLPGYYVEIGGTVWQLVELPSRPAASLKFREIGNIT